MATAWCLFEMTGVMSREFERVGYEVFAFDIQNQNRKEGDVTYVRMNLDGFTGSDFPRPCIIFSFAPCTDLAVSGARWFASKALRDPLFQAKAEKMARLVEFLGGLYECAWALENPVGVLSSRWREPDEYFHPYEFGGYCEGDHPIYPNHFPPRDAYSKKTGIWYGNGFSFPRRKPVDLVNSGHIHRCPPGPDRANIRSCTPRGFARAVALANMPNR